MIDDLEEGAFLNVFPNVEEKAEKTKPFVDWSFDLYYNNRLSL